VCLCCLWSSMLLCVLRACLHVRNVHQERLQCDCGTAKVCAHLRLVCTCVWGGKSVSSYGRCKVLLCLVLERENEHTAHVSFELLQYTCHNGKSSCLHTFTYLCWKVHKCTHPLPSQTVTHSSLDSRLVSSVPRALDYAVLSTCSLPQRSALPPSGG
jgi:hypothetical protein